MYTDTRRSRSIGLSRKRPGHVFTATAVNLIRLDAWWTAVRSHRPEPPALAALGLAA